MRPRAPVQNERTKELISNRKTSQTQQQRPESPTITLTSHSNKYKAHKLHRKYILFGSAKTSTVFDFQHKQEFYPQEITAKSILFCITKIVRKLTDANADVLCIFIRNCLVTFNCFDLVSV